ncbi:MAG: hypothetical protein JW730_13215 [Anaerolineales bacterium]|nr:hypothetical protein [Anaerolineales bacterium]
MKAKNFYWMAGLLFLIVVVCYVLVVYLHVSNAALSLMLVSVGLVTFYGTMGMGITNRHRRLSKYDIRLAIVISLITVYIVLVGTVVFFTKGGDLPPIAQTMITHFTTVVGVMIAFYFGAEAYEAVHRSAEKPAEDEDGAAEEK